MKKFILFLISVVVSIPIFAGKDQFLTSSIVSDINPSNSYTIDFDYFYSDMQPINDAWLDGFVYNQATVDTAFSLDQTDTATSPGMQINIAYNDSNFDKVDFCILQYNALTKSAVWLKNIPYQPVKSMPPIVCTYRIYPNHVFLFVKSAPLG